MAIRFDFKVQKKLKNNLSVLPDQMPIDFGQKIENAIPSVTQESLNDARFSEFYPKVVETLGITPTVFIDLIKVYSDEQFRQAIRVTHRAKMDGQIKTNISGFFVQALKNGYTDQKEERIKKEKKEEILQRIALQKHQLETEKQEKIYERIRKITNNDPSLTEHAIETLKQTELGRRTIQAEENRLDRPLIIEDFRQIKELRFLVIDTLFVKNMEQFRDILDEYDGKINAFTKDDIF